MKNILYVSTSFQTRGGTGFLVKELINSPLKNKYRLFHLKTHTDGGLLIKLFYMFRAYMLFPFIIVLKRISIVHIHGSMKSSFFRKSYFLIISKIMKKKVIYHMHSGGVESFILLSGTVKRRIITWLFNRYDRVISISKNWEHILKKYTATRVDTVFNGVSLKDIEKGEREAKASVRVLTMGELGERKGTGDILKIAKQLKGNGIVFDICGNGAVSDYRIQAKEIGAEESVIFHGWVFGKEKEEKFALADIYLLPSYAEGLPMSILEAMKHGLPVISTNVGGIPEAVIHNYNGFILKPGDINGFACKIKELALDKSLRENMGLNSKRLLTENFSIDQTAKMLEVIYEELIG